MASTPSYAAAAASGRLTPGSLAKSQVIKGEQTGPTPPVSAPLTNGHADSTESAEGSVTSGSNDCGDANAVPDTTQSHPSPEENGLKGEDTESTGATSWEKSSQASSHAEGKQNTDGTRTPESTRPAATRFVDAPPPATNVWQMRASERKPATSSSAAKPVEAEKDSEALEKSKAKGKKPWTALDQANGQEKPAGKAVEAPKTGNAWEKEDGAKKHVDKKTVSRETQTVASPPPPSMADPELWPTVDIAVQTAVQPEGRKEPVDKKDEKATSSRTKYRTLHVNYNYTSPDDTIRGGRGGRGGGRGGRGGAARQGGERNSNGVEQSTPTAELAIRERAGPLARGAYQGTKANKYANGPTVNEQRRGSKDSGLVAERKKGTRENGDAPHEVPRQASPTQPRQRYSRDWTNNREDVPGFKPYSEAEGSNDHSHPPPVNGRVEEPSNSYGPSDRGAGRPRGGFRGRGGYHAAGNGHVPYQAQMANGGYPQGYNGYGPYPRNGYRGARHSYSGPVSYRNNPAMTSPQQQQQYPGHYAPQEIPTEHHTDVNDLTVQSCANQVNFYFSVDNLCKDMYLRSHMDSDGYVKVSFISTFNRLANFSRGDINLVIKACLYSPQIDILPGRDNEHYCRAKSGWEAFVLSDEHRVDAAKGRSRNDWLLYTGDQMQYSANAQPFVPSEFSPTYIPRDIYNGPPPPQAAAGNVSQDPSYHGNGVANGGFVNGGPLAQSGYSSQPFVDELSEAEFMGAVLSLKPKDLKTAVNGEATSNGSGPSRHQVQRSTSDFVFRPNDTESFKGIDPQTIVHKPYLHAYNNAIHERNTYGLSRSRETKNLYQFWIHVLVDKLHNKMYTDFCSFALEDADQNLRIGIDTLYRFYSQCFLQRTSVPKRLMEDFVQVAKADAEHGDICGILRLRDVLKDVGLKEELRRDLESIAERDSAVQHYLKTGEPTVDGVAGLYAQCLPQHTATPSQS